MNNIVIMAKTMLFRRVWFLILIGGLVLFIASDLALISTSDPNYVPTVLLIGGFLIPVVFVAFLFQKVPIGEIPIVPVALTFLWGGALGVIVAGILEYSTLRQLGGAQLFGVGVIEESVKLILPLYLFFQRKYRHEADGLLFGIAAGMGFAALETMGYGFTTYIQSHNNPATLMQTLLVRGLLSPSGHAAWTGIFCAALWREREIHGHAVLNATVIGFFILAVFLHAMWDILGSISTTILVLNVFDYIGLFIVGGVSLFLLISRIRKAKHLSLV
jgi:protease PrsW